MSDQAPTAYDEQDLRFGREAIRTKAITADAMKVAIARQVELAAKGEKRRLSALLVEAGAISAKDAAAIEESTARLADAKTPVPDTVGSTTPADGGVVSPVLITGALIGRWKLDREIGRGGMGIIFRAADDRTNEVVALKILRDPGKVKHVERFLREMEATRRIDHPNIVKLHEVGHAGDLPWYAMELVAGEELDVWVEKHEPDTRDKVRLIRDVARAIHHAHGLGIIHRDLKPGNILVTTQGQPKVMDFGLAKLEDDERKITRTNAGVGTPQYMSPEQAQGRPCDARSDVFALGVVLFELVAGHIPWPGQTVIDVCNDVVNRPLPAYAYDRALDRVLQKACDKLPAERYESADALARDLDLWLESGEVSARGPALSTRIVRVGRRHVQLLVGAAMACIVFMPVLLYVGWRAAQRKPGGDVAVLGSGAEVLSSAAAVAAFAKLEAKVKETVAKDDFLAAFAAIDAFRATTPEGAKAAAALQGRVEEQARKLIAALAERGAVAPVEDAVVVLARLRALSLPPALADEREPRVAEITKRIELEGRAIGAVKAQAAASEALDRGDLDAASAALATSAQSPELEALRRRVARLEEGRAKLRAASPDESAPASKLPALIAAPDRAPVAEYLLATKRPEAALALAEAAGEKPLADAARARLAAQEARSVQGALEDAVARAERATSDAAQAASALRAVVEKSRGSPALAALRDRARAAFALARRRAIERDPLLLAVSGRARFADGVFSVTYDWSDPRAAQDWVADPQVAHSTIRVDTARHVATVRGHVTNAIRFAGRVRARTLVGSLDGDAANVNFVLDERGPGTGLLVALGFDDGRGAVALEGGAKVRPPLVGIALAAESGWRFLVATSGGFDASPSRPARIEIVRDETSVVVKRDGAIAVQRDALEGAKGGSVALRPGQLGSLVLSETRLEGALDAAWLASAAAEQARREAAALLAPD